VPELLLHVLGERLLDLLRPDAVEVDRGGEVAHHRLDLHPVGLCEQLDDVLSRLGVGAVEDSLAGRGDGHFGYPSLDGWSADDYPGRWGVNPKLARSTVSGSPPVQALNWYQAGFASRSSVSSPAESQNWQALF